jgi:hypothetical protein
MCVFKYIIPIKNNPNLSEQEKQRLIDIKNAELRAAMDAGQLPIFV